MLAPSDSAMPGTEVTLTSLDPLLKCGKNENNIYTYSLKKHNTQTQEKILEHASSNYFNGR